VKEVAMEKLSAGSVKEKLETVESVKEDVEEEYGRRKESIQLLE
jgi:hypothetical protein